MDLYNRIMSLCEKKEIAPSRMCLEIGVSKSAMTELRKGRITGFSPKTLSKIAEYFGVSVDYLLGNTPTPNAGKVLIPVYGEIAAGLSIEMVVDIEDYEEISEAMARTGDYFGLRIHGDSMEPRILNGDVIIVRKQDTCEDGDICAVAVNGDSATCKRVRIRDDGIMLISNNPAYDPMFYSTQQIADLPVRILGKVVELRGKV